MFQLEPSEKFVISCHLKDPQDTGTYYVRAFVRDKLTDELLATVNLTNVGTGAGDNRYTVQYEAPADPSGQGRFISVITKVYTDSGYTTLSPVYAIEEMEYLVQKRYNFTLGGGGGGADISYERIRKIIKEEKQEVKELEQIDFSPILEAIANIPKPEKPQKLDLSPVLEAIKNIPKPERVDLSKMIFFLEKIVKLVEKIPESDYGKVGRKLEALENILRKPLSLEMFGSFGKEKPKTAQEEMSKVPKFSNYFNKKDE